MRTTFLLLIPLIVLLTVSCNNSPTPIFVMENEATFTIEAGHNTIQTYGYVVENLPTFFNAFNNGSDTSDIVQLLANTAILRPRFEEINLDFINSINVFLLDRDEPTSRKELFFMDFVQLGNKEEIRLFNTIIDVEELMSRETFDIVVEINYRQNTVRSIDFVLDMTFAAYGD